MKTLKQFSEGFFTALAMRISRRPLVALLLVVVPWVALVSQVPKLRLETDTESFFHDNDPALVAYENFRAQFGRDEMVVVGVRPPEVFDVAFLERLREFHRAVEDEVPFVKEVTSLINARDTRAEGNTLVVGDLLEEMPATPEAMQALRNRVLGSALYPNLIISEDARFTTVMVETLAFSPGEAEGGEDLLAGFSDTDPAEKNGAQETARPMLSGEENSRMVAALRTVMARFEGPEFELTLAGSPVITETLQTLMMSNMRRFVLLSLLAIGLFLLVLFRRLSGVVLPLLVVLMSLTATVGLMAGLGVSFKMPLMILPSFLLAVGVGATVHLLTIFFQNYEGGMEKARALSEAMGHSATPILMTSLTTAAGLASFASAELAPVSDLGIFASGGVLVALVLTLVLMPALLMLLPIPRHTRLARRSANPLTERTLAAMGGFGMRHPWSVVLACQVLVLVALAGMFRLELSHDPVGWFNEREPVRIATDRLDHALKGTVSVEMLVETGRENGLYEPAVLERMEQMSAFANAYQGTNGVRVGKTNSLADVVKEIHQALNEDRPEFYAIPTDRELIAQELLLFENSGSDDLERLVDSTFSTARFSIKTNWRDASAYARFLEDMQAEANRLFAGHAEVRITGMINLLARTIDALLHSLVQSYTIALVVITVLMVLLIGQVRLGLLSMLPNLFPILLTLGLMGWLGLPLDAFTLLIGSIALGLAVDDTIHFFHNYIRYRNLGEDVAGAVRHTLMTSGRAMLFTTLVLVTGFWLYMFSTMNNLFNFGLLTGFALLVALLSDIVLAPALVRLAENWQGGK